MSDIMNLLERAHAAAVDAAPDRDGYEAFLGYRDRRRRKQRLTAGAVGIALFAVAIGIITDASRADRTQPSVDSGGPGTSEEPARVVTVPTGTVPLDETGHAASGDLPCLGLEGLPPDGPPSEPLHGDLINYNMAPGWRMWNVYADGRLIWARSGFGPCFEVGLPSGGPVVFTWIEQRLTPEGVQLLGSGEVELMDLPASAWERSELRPFVPSRYRLCLPSGYQLSSGDIELLPTEAQEIIRDTEQRPDPGCAGWEVTIQDARALVEILSDAGFELVGAAGLPGGFVMDPNGDREPEIEFWPVLPDGSSPGAGG